VGLDNIPAELSKHGGDTVLERMHRICVTLWETGEWPEDWMDSTLVAIPKKRPPKMDELQNNSFDLTCKQENAKDYIGKV